VDSKLHEVVTEHRHGGFVEIRNGRFGNEEVLEELHDNPCEHGAARTRWARFHEGDVRSVRRGGGVVPAELVGARLEQLEVAEVAAGPRTK